ncbi:hypothetical protein BGX24_009614 [Mortierella sp. AD032]|nr:hypothetical protein BGX24_009614 [Mortierella sp. AD032]
MSTPKEKKASGDSCPTIPSPTQSGPTRVKKSRFMQLEQATKNLFRSSIRKKDHRVSDAVTSIQFGSIGALVPQDHQGSTKPVSVDSSLIDLPLLPNVAAQHPISPSSVEANSKDLKRSASITLQSPSTALSAAASGDKTSIFPRNVPAPSLQVPLPAPGARLETTLQLAYCNQLLRTNLSLSSATTSITVGQDPSQQASADNLLRNMEEQQKIRELAIRVVEEFVTDGLKNAEEIAEVVLLGPFLIQEYYRKLLNCFIGEFEAAKLLDIDLLQGLVQLVQCAGPEYLQPTILSAYWLFFGLDLSRIVDHEPLSALLAQLMESSDPYLKHQTGYAHQGLLHIPNDETHRQFVLRHAGNITMGLLGVASVCNLDLNGFLEGAGKLRDATVSALGIGTKVVGGAQTLHGSGQGISASVNGGIFSGGRLIWYTALREAREHIQNGRLPDFNRLVFEAPCSGYVEFQWGVCQLVGEIAVDPQWEVSTRQHATELLAEMYRDDTICNSNNELDSWNLQIIRQVVASPDVATSSYAQLILQSLAKKGGIDKQTLYRDVMDGPIRPYPLLNHFPTPSPSPLLARIQGIPDVEYDIHRLRMQRLKEPQNALCIPPQAKPTLRSSDDTLFPLMEKMLEFLTGSGQVFLLLGDSGGGKSTFNVQLKHTLWKDYRRGGAIPIHINLPAIDNPQQDMIAKQLLQLHLFSEAQIQELRHSRQFIVICDGYDESQLKKNIYASNFLNQPGQWKAKMVISCRSQYLGSDYRSRFQPAGDRYQQPTTELFQEAVIASFSQPQIKQYVEKFVQMTPSHAAKTTQPSWKVTDYMDKLNKIPKLIELVANPFLLTMALRALPKISRSELDLSKIRLTRVGLYDNFIEQWLETNKLRLENSNLSIEAQGTLEALVDEGFVQQGIGFQKDLAAAIFQHQDGTPVVEYSHIRESRTWKASFSGPDAQTTLLRESIPLTRSGNQYRFLHRSILEYLYSRVVSDPFGSSQLSAHIGSGTSKFVQSFADHLLNQRNIVREPSILQFLAERVELDPSFESCLRAAIEVSKIDAGGSQAAANAISILVSAGVRFNGADLRGIWIPGADICGGQFDSADMQGADLSDVNLTKTWLRQANLSEAKMAGVQLGELPYLMIGEKVISCVFSSDGALLVVSTQGREIIVYETATWTKIFSYCGGYAVAISPTTRELAKAQGRDVDICDILAGKIRLVLSGHSDDVCLWDPLNCELLGTLSGHSNTVSSVSYSPNGKHIALGSYDGTVRLWDVGRALLHNDANGSMDEWISVDISPGGTWTATSNKDGVVLLWETQTGKLGAVWKGHERDVNRVAFSPCGGVIASAGEGGAVGLWCACTGESIDILWGHTYSVFTVHFSISGHQLASCSADRTVRLWDPETGEPGLILEGYTDSIHSLAFLPSGHQIASCSLLTGEQLIVLPHKSTSGRVMFSPDGLEVVSASWGGGLCCWDTQSGERIDQPALEEFSIIYSSYSPCGKLLVTGEREGVLRLWDRNLGSGNWSEVYRSYVGTLRHIQSGWDVPGNLKIGNCVRVGNGGRRGLVRLVLAMEPKKE